MEALKQKEKKLISLNSAKKIIIALIIVIIFDFFLFPVPAFASAAEPDLSDQEATYEELGYINNLPASGDKKVIRVENRTATAYTSEVAQCDASPCITANGFNVCKHGIEDTIAANFLTFGTKVRIPDLYGDRIFIVRDRMNQRYDDRIDIWMLDKNEARQFGVKVVKIEILEH